MRRKSELTPYLIGGSVLFVGAVLCGLAVSLNQGESDQGDHSAVEPEKNDRIFMMGDYPENVDFLGDLKIGAESVILQDGRTLSSEKFLEYVELNGAINKFGIGDDYQEILKAYMQVRLNRDMADDAEQGIEIVEFIDNIELYNQKFSEEMNGKFGFNPQNDTGSPAFYDRDVNKVYYYSGPAELMKADRTEFGYDFYALEKYEVLVHEIIHSEFEVKETNYQDMNLNRLWNATYTNVGTEGLLLFSTDPNGNLHSFSSAQEAFVQYLTRQELQESGGESRRFSDYEWGADYIEEINKRVELTEDKIDLIKQNGIEAFGSIMATEIMERNSTIDYNTAMSYAREIYQHLFVLSDSRLAPKGFDTTQMHIYRPNQYQLAMEDLNSYIPMQP